MVSSSATTVDGYLREVPADRVEALTRLRDLCRAELPGFTEGMQYGMPVYQRDGDAEVAFASQRRYISVYILRTDVVAAFADRLAGHDMGKACLRFRRPATMDFELLRDLFRATAAGRGPVC